MSTLKEKIQDCLEKSNVRGFHIDEESSNSILLATRNHGNVADEIPGQEDIDAARQLAKEIKTAIPNAKCALETVDEWVHLTISVEEPKSEINPALDPFEIAITVGQQFLQSLGFPNSTVERKGTETNRKTAEVRIPGKILVRDAPEYTPDILTIRYSTSHVHQLDLCLGWGVRYLQTGQPQECLEAAILGQLQELHEDTIKDGCEIMERLWDENPFNPQPGGIIIGHCEYDLDFHSSNPDPYWQDPKSGDITFPDPESKINFVIRKENQPAAFHQFPFDFQPNLPEGKMHLASVGAKIQKMAMGKIKEEFEKGEFKTLQSFGFPGKMVQVANGELYFVPDPA